MTNVQKAGIGSFFFLLVLVLAVLGGVGVFDPEIIVQGPKPTDFCFSRSCTATEPLSGLQFPVYWGKTVHSTVTRCDGVNNTCHLVNTTEEDFPPGVAGSNHINNTFVLIGLTFEGTPGVANGNTIPSKVIADYVNLKEALCVGLFTSVRHWLIVC